MPANIPQLARFRENPRGMPKLRASAPVHAELVRRAENIAAAATEAAGTELEYHGIPGMRVDSQQTKSGSRASVRTGTIPAMQAEATDRILSRTWQQAGRQ